jgi:hypothetical protein
MMTVEPLDTDERAELKFLREFKKSWETIRALSYTQDESSATVEFRAQFVQEFVGWMVEWFRDCNARNYIEIVASHPSTGPLVFTMQRMDGQTPAEKADEYRALLRALFGTVSMLKSWRKKWPIICAKVEQALHQETS